ncbi:MAG: bifunctional 4-hydroxy-2-oxoglutarate aldolase/2-dehydro-3-deoxy-phosphogluconate aldolase [Wenzhouxiangellaceae bacterium]|nr:bifunctional 4-hydroxy-2-oxoglutarate aldolase/2-dehydro-3-deoxy-phosphogluconate aldolase [Wenzhouxiangellaceae bacterium]
MISPTSANAAAIDELLGKAPVVPVLTVHDAETAEPLARALVEAGLPVLEVTLRTDAAIEAIRRMRGVDGAIVGAGTILSAADLERAVAAGAEFAIAPGCTPVLYAAAAESPVPFIPAVATASEVMAGLERGWRRFKFFPAEAAGGLAALRSLAGPFADVRFCPTGGIDSGNAADYLALPNVITVGGSWMVPAEALKARDWTRIGELAGQAASAAKAARK